MRHPANASPSKCVTALLVGFVASAATLVPAPGDGPDAPGGPDAANGVKPTLESSRAESDPAAAAPIS